VIAGIISSQQAQLAGEQNPHPNQVGFFVVHSAVRASLFGFLLHSELVLVAELEAEYGSAPSAVGWDVLLDH